MCSENLKGIEVTESNELRPIYGNTVYRLSDRGTQEVLASSRVLPQRMRRCLFHIDGFRTVRDLSYWLRASEIEEVFSELERREYVVRVSDGDADSVYHVPLSMPSAEKLESIKSAAIAYLRGRMGGAAASVIAEIEKCKTDMELRMALRAIENVLVAAFGKEKALEFLKSVGEKAMKV
jgi:hypothetical protein